MDIVPLTLDEFILSATSSINNHCVICKKGSFSAVVIGDISALISNQNCPHFWGFSDSAFLISSGFDCKVISGNTFLIADGTFLSIFGVSGDVEVELDSNISFIPCYLPFRIVSAMLSHEGDGFIERVESLDIFDDFSVSDCVETRAVRSKFL